ncbi:hypothetical protein N9174_00900, partial [bacterium]|nr:hypothetical protein [bacterium]
KEQAFISSWIINNFVSYLGESSPLMESDMIGNPTVTVNGFPGKKFFDDWTRKLQAIFIENCGLTEDDEEILESSQELKALLNRYSLLLESGR